MDDIAFQRAYVMCPCCGRTGPTEKMAVAFSEGPYPPVIKLKKILRGRPGNIRWDVREDMTPEEQAGLLDELLIYLREAVVRFEDERAALAGVQPESPHEPGTEEDETWQAVTKAKHTMGTSWDEDDQGDEDEMHWWVAGSKPRNKIGTSFGGLPPPRQHPHNTVGDSFGEE